MDKAPPFVSVVTPVYNGESYLAECIESVLGQSFQNWEYIVVNNCSSDRSLEIAERFAGAEPRIRIQTTERTLPFVENWNYALSLVSPEAKYIKVVHADDWLYPDCLLRMVELAEANESAGVIGSYVQTGDEVKCNWEQAPSEVVPGKEISRLSLLRQIPYIFGAPSALLFRSDLLGSRDGFYQWEDHGLVDQEVCHFLLQGTDFGYIKEVLTFSRVHSESLTSQEQPINTWYAGKLSLLRKYGPARLSEDEYDRMLDFWVRRYYGFLGKNFLRRRQKEFWDYHRRALTGLGVPFRWSRVAWMAVVQRLRHRLAPTA